MAAQISRYLSDDHARLDGLLAESVTGAGEIDQATYDQFRAGLLRHIGMEEKILFPALRSLVGGAAIVQTAKLRLDHGALAALLMPTPTPQILAAIRRILSEHNRLEEGPGGLYANADTLAAAEGEALSARLHAAPDVTLAPHSDSPAVMKTLQAALERAGYGLL